MSLNVLIIDDEYFIRQRLKKTIPWEALHLSFAGEAENGLEALKLVDSAPVDILLLDIKMPKMNGIELAEYVFQNHRDTKIIILSGYNDFEYARSAIKYGVTEYLLKPIDRESLTEALASCIHKINEERQIQFKLRQLKEKEITQALYQYLNGHMDYPSLLLAYPGIGEYSWQMVAGGFVFEDRPGAVIELMTRLSVVGIRCHYFKEGDYLHTLLLLFKTRPSETAVAGILNSFVRETTSYSFLVYSPAQKTGEAPTQYYKSIQYELNARYFHLEPCVVPLPPKRPVPVSPGSESTSLRQTLLAVLNANDSRRFHDFMDEIFDQIAEQKQIHHLLLNLTEIFLTYQLYFQDNVHFMHNIMDFTSLILEEEYRLANLEDTILYYGLQCIRRFEGSASDVALSQRVIAYLREHYANPELSIGEIAEHFQFNLSYLGSVFKKTQGCSILQYLTDIRLCAAERMLLEGAKISDAASQNGYSDVFYFSRRFKKKYGCSPRDYQLQNQK